MPPFDPTMANIAALSGPTGPEAYALPQKSASMVRANPELLATQPLDLFEKTGIKKNPQTLQEKLMTMGAAFVGGGLGGVILNQLFKGRGIKAFLTGGIMGILGAIYVANKETLDPLFSSISKTIKGWFGGNSENDSMMEMSQDFYSKVAGGDV